MQVPIRQISLGTPFVTGPEKVFFLSSTIYVELFVFIYISFFPPPGGFTGFSGFTRQGERYVFGFFAV